MSYPPPPAGYRDESGDSPFAAHAAPDGSNLLLADMPGDPLHSILSAGATLTNALRTRADTARLRAAGYTPATNSRHLDGDAIDLVPGRTGWSLPRLATEAKRALGEGFSVAVHNGTHVHISKPGWGAGLPAPPEGYDLAPEHGGAPPPPPGYAAASAPPAASTAEDEADAAALLGKPSGALAAMTAPPIAPPAAAEPVHLPDMPSVDAGLTDADHRPGAAVAPVPTLPNGESYQSNVDPKKNAQLQTAYDGGASVKQLVDLASSLGMQFEHGSLTALRQAVNSRDKGGRRYQFVPESTGAPKPGPLPGESMPAYVARSSGGATWDGPFTPEHPFGRNLRENLWQLYQQTGIKDPDEGVSDAQLVPGIGGAMMLSEAKQQLLAGHPVSAAGNAVLGALDFIPGPGGKAAKAGVHMIDSTALRVAATAGGEAPSIARAGEVLGGAVSDSIMAGGSVTLHGMGEARQIIGTNAAGELVDHAGAVVHPEDLARHMIEAPGGGKVRLEVNIPHAAASGAAEVEAAAPAVEGGATEAAPRTVDRIDVSSLPPLPSGARLSLDAPPLGRARPLGEQPTAQELADAARNVAPEDVVPIPENRIGSAEEAAALPSPREELRAPDPKAELEPRQIPSSTDLFRTQARRGPLDLSQRIRQLGGVKDEGGDLASMGVTNTPRRLDFGNDRGLGNLVNNKTGHSLDDMTERLHEEGWFPNDHDRPTTEPLLDALRSEHVAGVRVFHPSDAAEVERFRAAQVESNRIAAAKQEGAPLVEDRGQPITQEDLRANEPPATAYEDLPNISGKVGNLRLDKLDDPGKIVRAMKAIEGKFGGFDAAGRGVQTHAETKALAGELGMTVPDLLKARQGRPFNAEEAVAARALFERVYSRMVDLGKVAGRSDADRMAFYKAVELTAAVHSQLSGAVKEMGRAFQALKIPSGPKLVSPKAMRQFMESVGGPDKIEAIAEGILELQRQGKGPGDVARFAKQAVQPRFRDKLVELWYNWILSGPKTHAVNILSNTITALSQLPEHALAAGIGKARDVALGGATDRVMLSELGARATGLIHGTREGLAAAKANFLTERSPDFASKLEGMQHAISGTKGKVVRIPTRLLSAEDEFFKAVARKQEIAGLAVRQAKAEARAGKEGGKPLDREAVRRRAAELVANPTDDMVAQSMDYARYVTFQRPLGPAGQALIHLTNKMPILKVVIPFVRTPTNLLKYSVERSPFAPMLREWREDIKAGGARRDLALARFAFGSGLGATAAMWAAQGRITGSGPADPSAKRLMMADGWQPFSIRFGDHYVSYERLDPFALLLGTAADMATKTDQMTPKQREHGAAIMLGSIFQQMKDKTWLQGVADLIEAMDDPRGWQGKASTWASNLAGSIAVPALVAQGAQAVDPVARQPRGPLERIKSRIPFLSRSVPARLDVWGREAQGTGVSPLRTTTRRDDPVTAELLSVGVRFGAPSNRVGGTTLTPEQHHAYSERAGKYAYDWFSQAMSDPNWSQLDAATKRRVIDAVKNDARTTAREELFPELVGSQAAQ